MLGECYPQTRRQAYLCQAASQPTLAYHATELVVEAKATLLSPQIGHEDTPPPAFRPKVDSQGAPSLAI
jgi:hypothetical protein